jgi:hypothetical protein
MDKLCKTSKGGIMNYRKIVIDYLSLKQGHKCNFCMLPLTEEMIDIDHVKMVSKGGLDTIDNLQILHSLCHKKRHKKISEEKKEIKRKEMKENRELRIKTQFRSTEKFKKRFIDNLIEQYKTEYFKNNENQCRTAGVLGISERMMRYYLKTRGLTRSPNDWPQRLSNY